MVRTLTTSQHLPLSIGENAAENQALCKHARQNDLWFHLDSQPSPHAILSLQGAKLSDVDDSIHQALQLVKYFSKARNLPQVSAIYLFAKFVSKNGVEDKLGAVTLKKSPIKRTVILDEQCLETLLTKLNSASSSTYN